MLAWIYELTLAACYTLALQSSVRPRALYAYLFYNLYTVDPFGPPLQLRRLQRVQIVQIRTHETWIRLKEEHFKWYKLSPFSRKIIVIWAHI